MERGTGDWQSSLTSLQPFLLQGKMVMVGRVSANMPPRSCQLFKFFLAPAMAVGQRYDYLTARASEFLRMLDSFWEMNFTSARSAALLARASGPNRSQAYSEIGLLGCVEVQAPYPVRDLAPHPTGLFFEELGKQPL